MPCVISTPDICPFDVVAPPRHGNSGSVLVTVFHFHQHTPEQSHESLTFYWQFDSFLSAGHGGDLSA